MPQVLVQLVLDHLVLQEPQDLRVLQVLVPLEQLVLQEQAE